mmetsp:Transcript_17264/g.44998  ORF Transcript_17264/g.44998 Transcript_17264/m.44998 type:complete len:217 (+) Transcript_17264:1859-2509(+)
MATVWGLSIGGAAPRGATRWGGAFTTGSGDGASDLSVAAEMGRTPSYRELRWPRPGRLGVGVVCVAACIPRDAPDRDLPWSGSGGSVGFDRGPCVDAVDFAEATERAGCRELSSATPVLRRASMSRTDPRSATARWKGDRSGAAPGTPWPWLLLADTRRGMPDRRYERTVCSVCCASTPFRALSSAASVRRLSSASLCWKFRCKSISLDGPWTSMS